MVRSLLPSHCLRARLTALAVHAPLAGQSTADGGPDPAQTEQEKTEAAARWERLQAEAAAERQARLEAQERYEKGVAIRSAQREYERPRPGTRRRSSARNGSRPTISAGSSNITPDAAVMTMTTIMTRQEQPAAATAADTRLAPAEAGCVRRRHATDGCRVESCERQTRRNRRRGRVIGGILGSVAGGVAGDSVWHRRWRRCRSVR
jgi:hypothetical protein